VDAIDNIVRTAQEIFGARLLGMFAFGSRIAGGARGDSDFDLGVWLEPPLRRQTSWVPWVERLGRHEPVLDPTFFSAGSFADPGGWLLEAVHQGPRVVYDPAGRLTSELDRLARELVQGSHVRKLYMGLPYYRAAR
jgi:hypothetical protein